MNYIMVILGGGIGSVVRYFMSKTINQNFNQTFPLGTLVVNLIGCFLVGLFFGLFERFLISPNTRLLILVGFLGGFTTFSSFGLETMILFKDNEIGFGLLNLIISNIVGLFLVCLGVIVSHLIIKNFN